MVFPSEKGRGMSAYPYEMFQAPSGQNNSKMPHIAHKKLTPEDFPSYALFPIFDENFFILYLQEDLLLVAHVGLFMCNFYSPVTSVVWQLVTDYG